MRRYLDLVGIRMPSNMLTRLREEFSFVRGNLLILILSYTLFRTVSSMSYSFESLYIRELGASPLIIGLMSSLGSLIIALVRIPGAYVADRYGRRNVIAIFTFGVAFSYLFYALAPDWRLILVGVVILNLCHVYVPALEAIEADSIPAERRGIGYSAINVLPMLPAMITPPIGGYLVDKLGLIPGMRIAYAVVFVGSLLTALLRAFFLRETLEDPKEFRREDLVSTFRESFGSIFEAWREMPRNMVYLTVALLIGAFETPVFTIYMSLYAIDVVGVGGFEWSLMSTAFMLVGLLVGLPIGRMIDSIGRKKSILLAYLFSTPVIALFIISRGFIPLLVSQVLFAVSQAFFYPAFMAFQADLIPPDKRGRIMGVIGTMRTLAMVPAAALFGIMYESNPATPFIFAIALEVLTVAIVVAKIDEAADA
jgi:DHA1 family quinolone resistance protein-like MFS transporter